MTAITLASAYKQLQPAERSFVDGLVRELENAAMRAGERISNALGRPLPPHIIASDTKDMLLRPVVTAAITERVREIAADNELTPQMWIKHAMSCAFSSMANYVTIDPFDGSASIDLSKCTPEHMMAIESLEVEGYGGDGFTAGGKQKVKIKLHSKSTFMQMLGKYMGLVEPENPVWRADKAQQTPQIAHSDTVEAAGERYGAMLEGPA